MRKSDALWCGTGHTELFRPDTLMVYPSSNASTRHPTPSKSSDPPSRTSNASSRIRAEGTFLVPRRFCYHSVGLIFEPGPAGHVKGKTNNARLALRSTECIREIFLRWEERKKVGGR